MSKLFYLLFIIILTVLKLRRLNKTYIVNFECVKIKMIDCT